MPTPRPNLDNPFKPQEPSTISDADALSALLDPEDAADARRLLGDKKELSDPEADVFVLSAEEQAVADAEQVEAEKESLQTRYVRWAEEELDKDREWVEKTFTFHEDGTVTVEGDLDFERTDIKSFPEGLTEVTGYLYLGNCTSLTSLEHIPQTIGGNLSFTNCTSLTSLEHLSGVHIKGNLWMIGITLNLPENLTVDGQTFK